MNWLNLNIQTLDSENFLGSDPLDRATWLCLLRYCIGQENSGAIANCKEWADRKWQQLVRVTKKETARKCDLWEWNGETLVVWGYPTDKEDEIQQKRERAKTNGAKGGRPKGTNIGTQEEPTLVNSAKAEGERKGKEGEVERKGIPPNPQGGKTGKSDNLPTTPQAIQISELYRRKLTTPWSANEIRAFRAISPIDPGELDLVCRYEQSEMAKGETGWHKRDLQTFLNQFGTELDRARAWEVKPTSKPNGMSAAEMGLS